MTSMTFFKSCIGLISKSLSHEKRPIIGGKNHRNDKSFVSSSKKEDAWIFSRPPGVGWWWWYTSCRLVVSILLSYWTRWSGLQHLTSVCLARHWKTHNGKVIDGTVRNVPPAHGTVRGWSSEQLTRRINSNIPSRLAIADPGLFAEPAHDPKISTSIWSFGVLPRDANGGLGLRRPIPHIEFSVWYIYM